MVAQGLRQVGSCLFQGYYHAIYFRRGFLEPDPEKEYFIERVISEETFQEVRETERAEEKTEEGNDIFW